VATPLQVGGRGESSGAIAISARKTKDWVPDLDTPDRSEVLSAEAHSSSVTTIVWGRENMGCFGGGKARAEEKDFDGDDWADFTNPVADDTFDSERDPSPSASRSKRQSTLSQSNRQLSGNSFDTEDGPRRASRRKGSPQTRRADGQAVQVRKIPAIAVFLQECMGQLASYGPT
jgi:hypothetical protein